MITHKVVVNQQGGIGFLGLLTILFVALKLLGVISWSWLWVLVPIWGPFALLIALIFFIGLGAMVMSVLRHRREEKARIARRREAGCPY